MNNLNEVKRGLTKLGVKTEEYKGEPRVLPVPKDAFRTRLSLEDIAEFPGDRYYYPTNVNGIQEKVMIPVIYDIAYPDFSVFYQPWITMKVPLEHKFVTDVIYGLMYLNPEITSLGLYKMAQFLPTKFKAFDKTTKEIFEHIKLIASMYHFDSYTPLQTKNIIFEKGTLIDSKQRTELGRQAYHFKQSLKAGQLIHLEVTEMSKKGFQYKITKSLVKDTMLTRQETKIVNVATKSKKTFNSYFIKPTLELMKENNLRAPFLTKNEYEKYLQFVAIEDGMTYHELATRLSISKSKVKKFKEILTQVELHNLAELNNGKDNI